MLIVLQKCFVVGYNLKKTDFQPKEMRGLQCYLTLTGTSTVAVTLKTIYLVCKEKFPEIHGTQSNSPHSYGHGIMMSFAYNYCTGYLFINF